MPFYYVSMPLFSTRSGWELFHFCYSEDYKHPPRALHSTQLTEIPSLFLLIFDPIPFNYSFRLNSSQNELRTKQFRPPVLLTFNGPRTVVAGGAGEGGPAK